jgi:23S rRNA-intervening sequence protein
MSDSSGFGLQAAAFGGCRLQGLQGLQAPVASGFGAQVSGIDYPNTLELVTPLPASMPLILYRPRGQRKELLASTRHSNYLSTRHEPRSKQASLETALGSASEVRYLLGLSVRLEFLPNVQATALAERYTEVIKGLQKLIDSLSIGREP